ncbi:uncharacterized protein LOC129312198 [Prosopis cineraria]|uniref:uncharacterized protein LOC129312198 n=1 Tax=Prosopis cineraria TaxID=364024 RepID=UPI0024104A9A|nr:uncharacterized protein LOC129312198 [Prosopis cineraria]
MEERKFVCKYCNKKFPCGKSLGGHIRTHMSIEHTSPQSKEVRNNADDGVVKFDGGRKRKRDFGSEEAASGNLIYGLRDNPKQTTRLARSNAAVQKQRFCKECGKGFLSLKALCGHMACHSEKDKGTTTKFENNSGFSVKQKMLMMDSQSDTETSAPNYPRRSGRMRFKTVNSKTNDHPSSVPLANGSSPVSEVEQEQEEVARCLMLLSKDSTYRDRFVLPTESWDTRITSKNGKKSSVSNGFEIVEDKRKVVLCKNMKLKSAEIVDSDNSGSGYFRNGPRKLDLDVTVDKYTGNGEFKTPKVADRSESEFAQNYDTESRKMLIKNRGTRSIEPRKLILEDMDCDTTDRATKEQFINWKKRTSCNSLCQQNSIGVSCKKTPNGFHSEGSWKQESLNSEKTISGSYDSAYDESDESSTDTDAYPSPLPPSSKVINGKKTSKSKKKLKSKKSREHRCPICYRIFKSGQALGGHKRSHFVGGSEENTLVIKQGSPVVPCLIDLNLPAPVDY